MPTNREAQGEVERKPDYRRKDDMLDLAQSLVNTPTQQWPTLCAFIVDNDLMRPQWYIRLSLWIIRKRFGTSVLGWWKMEQSSPGSCAELIQATARWIIEGTDRTTRDAFGGLNQAEVDLLSSAIARAQTQEPDHG